ncbi:MAG TPA: FAD-dependent oxidoreductase, partial [Candidatus Angelobacter sp.]|nr:FAD-dependent oxidoreductase [Candidatus Angelobacter sp.]
TIRRLYSTREKNASKKERLGYVRGGYRTVCARLLERIEAMGGMVITNFPVEQIRSGRRGRVLISGSCENLEFDRVISTLPSAPFAEITPELDRSYRNKLTRIQYMGIVCVVLVLRRKLTPYYCTNLIEDLPFTGIIEMTNLISPDETNGSHLVYLPKYTSPGDPLFSASDDGVWSLFSSSIQRAIPDLRDDDIERRFIFRERMVQPIPVLNYSQLAPEMQTPVPNLLLANTTQIVNSTLNNNEMVKIARSAVDAVMSSAEAECEEYAPPALATAPRTTGLSTHI